MNKDVRSGLEDQVEKLTSELENYEVGSEEYKARIEAITKLTDRITDLKKIDEETEIKHSEQVIDENLRKEQFDAEMNFKQKQLDEQIEARKNEELLKEKQLKVERTSKWVSNGITIGLGLLNLGAIVWGTKTTLKFEETGTVTTNAGRNFINNLFKFRK